MIILHFKGYLSFYIKFLKTATISEVSNFQGKSKKMYINIYNEK